MNEQEFDKAIQLLWKAIKNILSENEKLKEDIKKLEDGLFKCNELKESYKIGNEKGIEYVKKHMIVNRMELLDILEDKNEYNK